MSKKPIKVKGYRRKDGTYVKGHNRSNPTSRRKNHSLFFPPKYIKYSEIISFESIKEAKKSIEKLENEYDDAKTDTKKRRIASVLQLSENRCRAMLEREDLSNEVRNRYTKIAELYSKASDNTWDKYNKQKRDYF